MKTKSQLRIIQYPTENAQAQGKKAEADVEQKIRELLSPGGLYVFRKTIVNPDAVKAIAENGEELARRRHPKRKYGSVRYGPAYFSGTLMERYLQTVDFFATKYKVPHVIYFLAENMQQKNEPYPELASRPAMHCIKTRDGRLDEYLDTVRRLNDNEAYQHMVRREAKEAHDQSTLIEFLHDRSIDPVLNHHDFWMVCDTDRLKTMLDTHTLPYE